MIFSNAANPRESRARGKNLLMHGNENKALYCGVFEWTISILKKHNSNVYNVLIYEWKFYHFHFAGEEREWEGKSVWEKGRWNVSVGGDDGHKNAARWETFLHRLMFKRGKN